MTTSIDRYKTLGVQYSWVKDYFDKKNNFWDNNSLGTMMLSPLKAFLADSGVSQRGKITPFGELVSTLGIDTETAWALMLCNAAYTSEINWWMKNISFNRPYTPAEIITLLTDDVPSEKSRKNVVSAFKNICSSNSILGERIGLGHCNSEQKGRVTHLLDITRTVWSSPDPLVILYSLYKFAEACEGYYQFTLTTLMDDTIERGGINIFEQQDGQLSLDAQHAIAGILGRIREISLFLNPLPSSYQRLGCWEAPKRINWSFGNRSQLVRIPAAHPGAGRMELRSPDPACNPYLAFALVLAAAMEGITEVTPLQAPLDDSGSLPESLEEAISLAEKSAFIREVLPENVIDAYLAEKKKTAARFEADANAVFQQHLRTI